MKLEPMQLTLQQICLFQYFLDNYGDNLKAEFRQIIAESKGDMLGSKYTSLSQFLATAMNEDLKSIMSISIEDMIDKAKVFVKDRISVL